MKIHDFPFAPNPRKLRIYLAEKGLEIPFETVNLVDGEHKRAPFIEMNPMGGVPILELDDGRVLSESLAIIEYLEELHPDPPMIGSDPFERARVRRLERIAELGVLGSVARYVHNHSSPLPNRDPNPELAEQARAALPLPLGVLDREAADRRFLAGDRPTIADCTLFAACAFAGFGELDLVADHPNLKAWHARMSERPSTRIG